MRYGTHQAIRFKLSLILSLIALIMHMLHPSNIIRSPELAVYSVLVRNFNDAAFHFTCEMNVMKLRPPERHFLYREHVIITCLSGYRENRFHCFCVFPRNEYRKRGVVFSINLHSVPN